MSYKLLCVDNGYLYTKDSNYNIFKSAYSHTKDVLLQNDYITINNQNYYYGVGNTCTDIDKIESDVNKVCTLTSIAKDGGGNYILCVNLPIIQFATNKTKLESTILTYNDLQLVYKDKQIKYKIHEVYVLPQGICLIYSLNSKKETIIIDLGSNTINFSLFEQIDGKLTLTKYDTKFKGLLHLYKLVISEINSRFTLNYNDIKAQYFLNGNPLIKDGVTKDTSFIKDIIRDYMIDILSDFKLSFPYKTTEIYICGGGAELLYPIFQHNFPSAIKVSNPQFANINGMIVKARNEYSKYL